MHTGTRVDLEPRTPEQMPMQVPVDGTRSSVDSVDFYGERLDPDLVQSQGVELQP